MKTLVSFFIIICLFSCSKSDSDNSISVQNSTTSSVETFDEWSPAFTDQTTNFTQSRTGSKDTKQTRDITVTSQEQIIEASEESNNLDVNEDSDKYDITSQTVITYTASEDLGSFSSPNDNFTIKYDIDVLIKNEGTIEIDYTSLTSGEIIINAEPSSGYNFLGWDGPSISRPTSVNPLIINIDSDQDLKANFLNINDPDYSGIGFYADPIFSQIDPENLLSYLDAFILDAERYGVDLSYVKEGCINIFLDPNFTIAAGGTNAFCKDNQVRIQYNKTYWEDQLQMVMSRPYSNPLYSETTMYGFHLMWHELGHDILNMGHTCNETPNFSNHPTACEEGSGKNLKYTRDMLWFTDDSSPETSEENIGFHRALSNYYNKINQALAEKHGLSCPCPSIETCIDSNNVTCGWRWYKSLGESIIPSDWCFTQDYSYENYGQEYMGACTDDKSVSSNSIVDEIKFICEGVPLY